jgi:hypothetical protein
MINLESCKLLLHGNPELMLHHFVRSHEVPLALRIPLMHLLYLIVVLLLILIVWQLLREMCDGLGFLKLCRLSTQLRIHPLHLALLVLMHSVLGLNPIQYHLWGLLLLLLVRVKTHLLDPSSLLLLQGLQEEHDNLGVNDGDRLRATTINCL